MVRIWIAAAGLGGFAAVALGAATRHLGWDASLLEIATRYLMYHALALLAAALFARGGADLALKIAGWSFLAGMVAFAGGLSVLWATGWAAAAAATPIGGTLFMIGWLALAWHGVRRRP
jgi:uncharacterized membrane protein YgdD (TMEM256/DUF423 family)